MDINSQDFVAVPLSVDLYRRLLERPFQPHVLIENVIQDYLDRTAQDIPSPKRNRGRGMHWEATFLPEKTRIRTKHHGIYKYAEVKGDFIAYEGETFSSISGAINRMRGDTQNNAWKVTQVMRPTDTEWVGAVRIRRRGGP